MNYPNLRIRFHRFGRKHYLVFRIVVTYDIKRNRGRCIDYIGFYNPHLTERKFYINHRRLAFWLNRGAKISPKVMRKLIQFVGT